MLGFEESSEAVHVRLRAGDGATAQVECRYLVAADGANSRDARSARAGLWWRDYAEDWSDRGRAERPDQTLEHIEFNLRSPTPDPAHAGAGPARALGSSCSVPAKRRELMERDDTVRELLRPTARSRTCSVARKAVYRFHARTCERFGRGRVFLTGDAAHLRRPSSGQGLVAGLRDAANLAWKLAWVLRGAAAPSILESYDSERRPHARAMIDLARFMGHLVMPAARSVRSLSMGDASSVRPALLRLRRAALQTRTAAARAAQCVAGPGLARAAHQTQQCFESGLFVTAQPPVAQAGPRLPQSGYETPGGAIVLSDEVSGTQ